MVMPYVRDCSTPAALVAARFACIEFYKLTLWQQEPLEAISILAGQSAYEIELQPHTVPAAVMRVDLDGRSRPLVFKTKDELDQLYGLQWTTLLGTPSYVTQIEPDVILLVPGPDTDAPNALRLLVAVQPTPDALDIDDTVFNYYSEALAYGTRARLVETAGQPYYDPQSAPMLWGKFYAGVSEAKARRMREHSRAVQQVQMRRWV